MPDRKKIVHICVKCGKQMEYPKKKTLYLYNIVPHWRGHGYVQKKRYAVDLCPECAEMAETMLRKWAGGA